MSYDRKTEPTLITQGERMAWTLTLIDYPATEYTLAYYFRGSGPGFNVAATAAGMDYDNVILPAQSLACAIDKYHWQAWLTEIADSTNVFCVREGLTNVERGFNPSDTASVDMRSPAKQILDAIDAALKKAGESDIVEYELSTSAGKHVVKRRTDLLDIRREYARIVANENARERARTTGKFGTTVKVRMFDNHG